MDGLAVSHMAADLVGSERDQQSIRVNDQWRICFVWRDNEAWEVEIVDYH